MATVTKSSIKIGSPIVVGNSTLTGPRAVTYTVPANSYAIVNVNLVEDSSGSAPAASQTYRLDAPSAILENAAQVTINTPIYGIYLAEGQSITTVVQAGAGIGATSMIVWGVLFTNS